MNKVGLIVNPFAGIGGEAGLKGSDGKKIQKQAIKYGAEPKAPKRAVKSLNKLKNIREKITVITYPDKMGEYSAKKAGFKPKVVGKIDSEFTTPQDTKRAARIMLSHNVDILLFAGGDGTARDIYEEIGTNLIVLGIPSGVKIHSSVFGINPELTGELVNRYLTNKISKTVKKEVMDIDEDLFRKGEVKARLYGYLKIPENHSQTQNPKGGNGKTDDKMKTSIANYFIRNKIKDNCLYIIGPGTTTAVLMENLGFDYSLLGVDVFLKDKLLGKDLSEKELLKIIENNNKYKSEIIITIIGGQGFIFGRGNQQISARVIRKVGVNNINIIATKKKISNLSGPLLIDIYDDPQLKEELCGYYKVITDYKQETILKAH